jgi:hypothetical protein
MTVLARRVRATPYRSADKAWEIIVSLLASNDSPARDELTGVNGIASSLIASEAPKGDPIVVHGVGPRLRIYCVYDEDAFTGDNANEQRLPQLPTDGDWSLSLPCPEEDLLWVKEALAKKSKRVTARKLGESVDADVQDDEEKGASAPSIDKEAFYRP